MPISNVICLFFDSATEAKVKALWASIAQKTGLPDKLGAIPKSRPHLSLGIFEEGPLGPLLAELALLAAEQAAFPLDLGSLGIFDGTRGIPYLGPASSQILLDLHRRSHARLARFSKHWNELYLPGRLVFHCSLNIGLSKEELLLAAGAAMDLPLPLRTRVESLGLLQLPDGAANRSFPLAG